MMANVSSDFRMGHFYPAPDGARIVNQSFNPVVQFPQKSRFVLFFPCIIRNWTEGLGDV